jgi:ABC-type glutathione transport system ATPase component
MAEVDIEHSPNPGVSLAASNVREDRGDKKDPPTGQKDVVKILPLPDTVSSDGDLAIVKSGVLPSSPMTVEEGHKSMSTNNINSQYLPSPGALQYRQANQGPSKAAHANLIENRECSKVHILGSSGAGKTTLLKSMLMYCGATCSHIQREKYKEVICGDLIEDMEKIFDVMRNLNIEFDLKENHCHARTVTMAKPMKKSVIVRALKALWDDPSVQECFRKSKKCHLNDPCG